MRFSPLWNVATTNSVSRSLGAIPLAPRPPMSRGEGHLRRQDEALAVASQEPFRRIQPVLPKFE
jgi:hypothetical protein